VNTSICGKEEENCAELARSKYSTINVQIIQQPFQSFLIVLITILLSVMGKIIRSWKAVWYKRTKINPARQLSHNFTLNIQLYDTDL